MWRGVNALLFSSVLHSPAGQYNDHLGDSFVP